MQNFHQKNDQSAEIQGMFFNLLHAHPLNFFIVLGILLVLHRAQPSLLTAALMHWVTIEGLVMVWAF